MPQAGSQYDDDHNQIWIQRLIPANNSPAQFDTDLHQLDPLQGRTPDWSPNDSFLTFESRRGGLNGNYAIFIESALTGEALQVTGCQLNGNHALWSPDGRRFAFFRRIFPTGEGLCGRMPRYCDCAGACENRKIRNCCQVEAVADSQHRGILPHPLRLRRFELRCLLSCGRSQGMSSYCQTSTSGAAAE
jgi:hypothetical protein